MKIFEGWKLVGLYGTFSKIQTHFERDSAGGSLSEQTQEHASMLLRAMERQCSELGLVVSVEMLKNAIGDVQAPGPTSAKLGQILGRLTEAIPAEMKTHSFLYIEPAKARYYSGVELFGEQVAQRFPSTSFDVEEAGKCLALDRGTACVFHLMRVFEIGLYALADNLGIQDIQINWHNAIEQIQKAIGDLDKTRPAKSVSKADRVSWKSKKQSYSEAATHFMYVKDAWRNRVSHSGQVYTVEKSEQIFDNVKGFMQVMAQGLDEGEDDAD